MPTTSPSLKYPEDYNGPDYLYWNPKVVSNVPSRERGWVARMVTVKNWQVIFDKNGEVDKQGEPVWVARKLGYVQELNRYVPEEELRG